jgi:hypothetical protein
VIHGKDAKNFLSNLLVLATQKETASTKRKKQQRENRMKENYNIFLSVSEVGVL